MQQAPAQAPTTTDTTAPRIIHRAHRCNKVPGKITWCGLTVTTGPIPPQRAAKYIPCAVCEDMKTKPCERCKTPREEA